MIRRVVLPCLLLCGCLSIPDDVRADLAPPERGQPNNYGLFVEASPGEWVVEPYGPTIAPIAAVGSGS